MKKIAAIILCLLFCLPLFTACSTLEEGEKGANIRVALTEFPQTLDPAVVQLNNDVEVILSLIFEPLVTVDGDGKIVGALAEEWYYKYDDIYDHNKIYFKLKDTAWSDKRAVRADDVIYAWRRILSPAIDSPYASLLYSIRGARAVKSGVGTIDDLGLAAVDDTLLEVTFEEGYEINAENMDLFLEAVANVHLSPCREDIVSRYEKTGTDWAASAGTIVCSGPFRIQSMEMPHAKTDDEEDYSDKFACKLVLERNSYYMRDDEDDALDKYVLPHRITCYYMEGQTGNYPDEVGTAQEAFQAKRYDSGELYILGLFNKETYNAHSANADTLSTLNGFNFYFNTANEVLSNADVRKALAASLDRNAFAELLGCGAKAATGYVPKGVFNTNRKDDFRTVGGDIFSASADANAADGMRARGSFTVSYLIPQNEYTVKRYTVYRGQSLVDYDQNFYKQFAELAADTWTKLGFDVKTKGLYYNDYITALKNRDYDVIGINSVMGSVDAFAYLAPYAKEYSGTGVEISPDEASDDEIFNTHYTNLDDADYNALINSILLITDRGERAGKLHEAEAKLAELCPAVPVIWYSYSYVGSDKISGIKSDSWFGYLNLNSLKLKDWRDVNSREDAASAAASEANANG